MTAAHFNGRSRILQAGLLIVAIPALAAGPAPVVVVDETRGRISGTVRDAATEVPLSEATVFLYVESGGCPSTRTWTDPDGRYEFAPVAPGRYRVTAWKGGHQKRYFGEQDRGGFGREIIVHSNEELDEVDVLLPRGAEIAGSVVDHRGVSVSGAFVFFDPLNHSSRIFNVVTDDAGRYRVTDLPPGPYHVRAKPYSVETRTTIGGFWFHPGTFEKGEASVVTLGEKPTEVSFRLPQVEDSGSLWIGRMFDRAGWPIRGVRLGVQRRDAGEWSTAGACTTGDDGSCELAELPVGAYRASTLQVPAPYAPWVAAPTPDGEAEAPNWSRFDVGSRELVTTEFQLSESMTLTGVVTMEDGSPVRKAHGLGFEMKPLSTPDTAVRTSLDRVESRSLGPDAFRLEGLASGLTYLLQTRADDPDRTFCVTGISLIGGTLEAVPQSGYRITLDPPAHGAPTLEVRLQRASSVTRSPAGAGCDQGR